MKFISWNVNGLRACKDKGFEDAFRKLDADFYVFSGHKVYGPTGIGVLYGKEAWLDKLPPYQGGGEMIKNVSFEKTTFNELPFKFEAGTPDYIGSTALAKALENRSLPLPVHVTGTDISAAALAVAAENARRQRCCISFYQSDLLDIFIHPDSADLNRLFDCVVANPPYVPEHIVRQLLSDGRCEPEQALNGDRDGSADGTGIIRRLIPQVFCLLQQGGCFLLEAG